MNLEQYNLMLHHADAMKRNAKSLADYMRAGAEQLRRVADDAEREAQRVSEGDIECLQRNATALMTVGQHVRNDLFIGYTGSYRTAESAHSVLSEMWETLPAGKQQELMAQKQQQVAETKARNAQKMAEHEAKEAARCKAGKRGETTAVRGYHHPGGQCTRTGTIEINGDVYCKQHAKKVQPLNV